MAGAGDIRDLHFAEDQVLFLILIGKACIMLGFIGDL
jgi:hypothetical protein